MQKHKLLYLRNLLARNHYNCIEDCVSTLRALEVQARQCYFEPVELDADEFVKMMLLDGGFIIEFLIKMNDETVDEMDINDWSLSFIWSDLLLLDNQIPFFVIESLFDLLVARFHTASSDQCKIPPLMELLVTYITEDQRKELPAEPDVEIYHLLHVYYLCLVGAPHPECSTAENSSTTKWLKPTRVIGSLLSHFCRSKWKDEKRSPTTIPCATELAEAGVTFKKKAKKNKTEENSSGSFLDIHITFRNGVLEIPFLLVVDSTKPLFMNLVAFEQCISIGEIDYMTSYVHFMDHIISTARDVEILYNSGIIENHLASEEELAFFFNQLCKDVMIDFENQAPLFKEVREYCESKRHKWRAKLMKDYFSNPWAIFSLVAAIILLIFAFLQTFFTIFPYFHP